MEAVKVRCVDVPARLQSKKPKLAILGTRGIPAQYGGFETFAERLALYLVERGWEVDVYCQSLRAKEPFMWRGVRLIPIAAPGDGPAATVVFDLRATLHSLRTDRLPLVLGYNTAALSLLYRLFGRASVMNMDGLEWRRGRWPRHIKFWYWINERFGCLLSQHLIADHPEIKVHLGTRVRASKITMIPYGADPIRSTDPLLLKRWGLKSKYFSLTIGRVVPENSTLDIVRGWSRIANDMPLVVLGELDPVRYSYHRAVSEAAGPNVRLLGAVYDQKSVRTLRYHARFYIHGHTVGGTNPSLVEALGAGLPIIAHRNCFNAWVTGTQAYTFADEDELVLQCQALQKASVAELNVLSCASLARHVEAFQWNDILARYEKLLHEWVASDCRPA